MNPEEDDMIDQAPEPELDQAAENAPAAKKVKAKDKITTKFLTKYERGKSFHRIGQ